MKLLMLGNSTDALDAGPHFGAGVRHLAAGIERAAGEPVDVISERMYPSPGLPRYVDRLLSTHDPDAIVLTYTGAIGLPLLYPRWERVAAGPRRAAALSWARKALLRGTGIDLSFPHATGRWPQQRLYAALCGRLLEVGAGRALWSFDEAVAPFAATVRAVVARERAALIVRGPFWAGYVLAAAPRLRRDYEQRLRAFDTDLAAVCHQHRVPYSRMLDLLPRDMRGWLGPDGFHPSAAAQTAWADDALARLLPLLDLQPVAGAAVR